MAQISSYTYCFWCFSQPNVGVKQLPRDISGVGKNSYQIEEATKMFTYQTKKMC